MNTIQLQYNICFKTEKKYILFMSLRVKRYVGKVEINLRIFIKTTELFIWRNGVLH